MEPHLRKGLILGMGNPLLDISAKVQESFLKKYDMKPNNQILAEEKHKPLYEELVENYKVEYTVGGSTQNALRVAQWILCEPNVTVFMGCVGKDKFSTIMETKARAEGVDVKYQYTDKEPTGTCAVLITSNGAERSLCANLAAANCFTIDHIRHPENRKLIDNALYYYVSGFFLTVSPESILEVADCALKKDSLFMMNLSAPFLSQYYSKPMMEAMPYVDILFGNELEAAAFAKSQKFGTEDLREVALKITQLPKLNKKRPRIAIITQGENPVLLAKDGIVNEFSVTHLPPEKVIDTNGAGDAFVGGFLSQLVLGKPVETCIRCGVYAATEIIQRYGCTYEGVANFVE
ncbi:adenosine kinase isoform X1 [Schistocerca americana]|uniref:adenosine kinase isoform X1 n=1 Tax=Schistocerca americana TaxID=7009 RepID=UPI001F4FCB1A|nr:adenosine kinase isoform X1 [Schistocerca americana]XP_047105475.1 adenosine kinase isoform X2 [Schistocerca piceifrons]XP_049773108.1 uncharacterized protein LOC126161377 isoform X1 [Schistocerca cancellata]XP_049773109.1 uncharacterized protein LOC126161377 isoform X1 [Schistocerca cancellata]XP_049948632.1 uncharacterized protein LOC126456861 isoform X1 [Schistocerca serialis cubense]